MGKEGYCTLKVIDPGLLLVFVGCVMVSRKKGVYVFTTAHPFSDYLYLLEATIRAIKPSLLFFALLKLCLGTIVAVVFP